MNEELKIKDFLVPVIVVLVMLRVYMIAQDVTESGAGLYYMIRQGIYTAAWASIIWFMSEVTMRRSNSLNKSKVKRMKNASLCAMIACLLKFAVTLAYLMPFNLPSLTLAYSILELLAWLMLAIYFYCFWKKKREQEKRVGVN